MFFPKEEGEWEKKKKIEKKNGPAEHAGIMGWIIG